MQGSPEAVAADLLLVSTSPRTASTRHGREPRPLIQPPGGTEGQAPEGLPTGSGAATAAEPSCSQLLQGGPGQLDAGGGGGGGGADWQQQQQQVLPQQQRLQPLPLQQQQQVLPKQQQPHPPPPCSRHACGPEADAWARLRQQQLLQLLDALVALMQVRRVCWPGQLTAGGVVQAGLVSRWWGAGRMSAGGGVQAGCQ